MDELTKQNPEVPVIIIERDDGQQEGLSLTRIKTESKWQKYTRRLLATAAVLCLLACIATGLYLWDYYYRIGVPVSVTPTENIRKLRQQQTQEASEVVMTSDSILGVALDFYAIHGLTASIEFVEPDTADASVYLYCRSADHTPDSCYIGSLVSGGKELQSDKSRLGYMAMADAGMVIGVSRSDKVKDYVKEHGGSFFRQFVLVSKGTIPHRFYLHGKVERRAIGRIGDRLFYVATRHKETLWDFADALREYGFIDAIYITGGTDYCFYRGSDGIRHDIGSPDDYPHSKWKGIIPWLVFRKEAPKPSRKGREKKKVLPFRGGFRRGWVFF